MDKTKLIRVFKYAGMFIGALFLLGVVLVFCVMARVINDDKALVVFVCIGLATIILSAVIVMSRWSDTIPKKEKSYSRRIFIVMVILGVMLPFHYVPDHLMIFPKDSLTFSNTFITQSDIDGLTKRYNDASFWERQSIREEPLMRKLMEKGLVVSSKERPTD